MNEYEQKVLDGWEDVFKKGQLTLWIFLALKQGPKHMADIKRFIEDTTNNTVSADDRSIYRALRRYYDTELVTYQQEPGKGGPDRKIYSLTKTGMTVLDEFTARNITNVFFKPTVRSLLEQRTTKEN